MKVATIQSSRCVWEVGKEGPRKGNSVSGPGNSLGECGCTPVGWSLSCGKRGQQAHLTETQGQEQLIFCSAEQCILQSWGTGKVAEGSSVLPVRRLVPEHKIFLEIPRNS